MSEPDPLNRLSRVANQPEQPAPEFTDRLLTELLSELTADQTGPTDSSFDHTIHETAMEVIMLSPNVNEPPKRNRTWLMATAAAVAALALIGGLVAIGTRADEDPAPANEPEVIDEPEIVDEADPSGGPETVEPVQRMERLLSVGECTSGTGAAGQPLGVLGLVSTDGLSEYASVDGEMLRLNTATEEITTHGSAVDECALWLGDETVGRRVALSATGDRVWFGPFDGPWETEYETDANWGLLSRDFSANRLVFLSNGARPRGYFGSDRDTAIVVDATTGERVGEPIVGLFSANRDSVPVAVSGDGSLLAIRGERFGPNGENSASDGENYGGVVYVLDAETGDQLFEVELAGHAGPIVFDDLTDELIVGQGSQLVTIDLASREVVNEVSNSNAASINELGIRDDGLVIAFSPRRIELIDRVTGPTGTEVRVLGNQARVQPDGNVLVVDPSSNFFEVWALDE